MSTPPTALSNEYHPPEPVENDKTAKAEPGDWRLHYLQEQHKQQKQQQQQQQINREETNIRGNDKILSNIQKDREENVSDLSWFAGPTAGKAHDIRSMNNGFASQTATMLKPPPGAPRSAELHYRIEPQTLDDKETEEGAEAVSTFLKQRNLITSSDSGDDNRLPAGWPMTLKTATTTTTFDAAAPKNSVVRPTHKSPFRVQPSDLDPFGDAEDVQEGTPLSPISLPVLNNVNTNNVRDERTFQRATHAPPQRQDVRAVHADYHNHYLGQPHQSLPQPAVILIPSSLVDSFSHSNAAATPYYTTLTRFPQQAQTTATHNYSGTTKNVAAPQYPQYTTVLAPSSKKADASITETGVTETTTAGDDTLTFSRGATSSTMPLPFQYPNDDDDDDDDNENDSNAGGNSKAEDNSKNGGSGREKRKQEKSRRLLLRHTTDTMERSNQGSERSSPKTTQQYNKLFRQRKKVTFEEDDDDDDDKNGNNGDGGGAEKKIGQIGDHKKDAGSDIGVRNRKLTSQLSDRFSNAAVSEHSGMESTKMHILANPRLLLNVFTFWINLLACHGTSSHNACVHSVLSDLNDHFERMVYKKRMRQRGSTSLSVEEEKKIARASEKTQRVLDDLQENLGDRSYDTTHAIVNVVNAVGPYVLRSFLVETQVISLDPYTSDTASAWAHVIAASDPTLPYGAERKLTDPSEMLRRMAWSKNLTIPGL